MEIHNSAHAVQNYIHSNIFNECTTNFIHITSFLFAHCFAYLIRYGDTNTTKTNGIVSNRKSNK